MQYFALLCFVNENVKTDFKEILLNIIYNIISYVYFVIVNFALHFNIEKDNKSVIIWIKSRKLYDNR